MNLPQFKIHGNNRRALKKEFSSLKSSARTFWHYHQEDIDMARFYGSRKGFPMSQEEAQKKYDSMILEISRIEKLLSEPYIPSTNIAASIE